MSDIPARFGGDSFYQETARGRMNRTSKRNLKAIGYDKLSQSIIVEDPETKEKYPIKINLMNDDDVVNILSMMGTAVGTHIDKNDSNLKIRAKKIYSQILSKTLPAMKATGDIQSKLGLAENGGNINVPKNILTRLRKDEFKAMIDHEVQHSHQERMAKRGGGEAVDMAGYQLPGGKITRSIGSAIQRKMGLVSNKLNIGLNATTDWIKDYVNSPAGKKLNTAHDKYLFELEADAAAVRKNGAVVYTRALMHLYGMQASMLRESTINTAKTVAAQNLDKNIKALNDLKTYLHLHDGDINDATLTKYMNMSGSAVDKISSVAQQIVKQIRQIKSYAVANGIPIKFGTMKEIMSNLNSVEQVVNSFQNPYTTLSANRKEKLLQMDPSKRIQYVDAVYQRCLDARKKSVNIDKQLARLDKILAKTKNEYEARCEFCRAIEKAAPWTKAAVAEFVAMIPELFGIVFTEEYTMGDLADDILSSETVYEMFDGYEDPFEDMIVEYAITQEQPAYDCNTYDSEGGETHMSDFNRFHRPGFYQEEEDQLSDDKDITVGDLDLENDDDDQSQDELPGYLEGRMSDEDRNKFNETENMDPNDVELGSFGSDNSDVQNDYDQKDVDTLMKLMASEADALGEYLDAAKETNTDVLRRLYADIGDEERFHMEQLLFAKSELTGEKYEPKDPDVKKEYEELLAMGMDEETAMQTAVDKCHIRVSVDKDSDQSFEDSVKELDKDVTELQETFELIEVTSNIILEAYEHNDRISPYVTPIMECAFYQEAFGQADRNWDPNTSINPFKLLGNLIGKAINLILNLVEKFRKMFNQTKNRMNNARAFVKEHGYGAIFQQGIHLYFEPVMSGNKARINPLIWKWYLCTGNLHNASVSTLLKDVRGLPIKTYDVTTFASKQPSMTPFMSDANVITCSRNIPSGIQILDKLDLIKTKMPVPPDETQRQTMFDYLTGYMGDDKAESGRSDNFINQISMHADIWKHMMVAINNNINVISDQRNTSGSTYNKNASKNDIAYRGIKACVETCQKFSKCLMSDIKEIAAVCNTVYSNMMQQDNGDIENNHKSAGKHNASWEKYYGSTRVAADQINTKKTNSMK